MNVKLNKDERIDDLEYKNLKIIQKKDGFKFGIDSVLLTGFAKKIKAGSTVVDLGSGTGVISLLLSKKTKAKKIYAVEIQDTIAEIAKRNVQMNDIENIEVLNIDLKNISSKIKKESMDIVVTNPPYKKLNSGLLSDDEVNLISRHEYKCNLEDVIKCAKYLLKDKGELYMVHRAERLVDIMSLMREYKIEPKIVRFVSSKVGEKPTMILVKGVKNANEFLKIEDPLYIYNEDGTYTDEIYDIYEKEKK